MLTLGLGLLLAEAANSASWLTGGADGLQGVKVAPLLGFKFDLYGRTAYAYSLAVLFLLFLAARRIIHSPFGLALRGIRENATRMPAIGAPSHAHLRKRSEEHTSELQSQSNLVCRLLLEKKNNTFIAQPRLVDRST